MPVSKKEISPCPIDTMLSVVDGRWKGTILWRLLDGPMRTSELRRSIPGITERMLIRHLQEYLVFETRKRRHLQTRSTQLPAFRAVFLWQFCANIEPRL
jgi:DNA-binding HxlR family transcriptional regulator